MRVLQFASGGLASLFSTLSYAISLFIGGFSAGGIVVKSVVLLLFLWGFLSMAKLSHGPL